MEITVVSQAEHVRISRSEEESFTRAGDEVMKQFKTARETETKKCVRANTRVGGGGETECDERRKGLTRWRETGEERERDKN